MADNKKKTGKADRIKVAGGEGYEVNYFANKHGITREQARKRSQDREQPRQAEQGS
jgi:hypothetical protein